MTQSKLITTTELDFDAIKSNLKNFLSGQSTLTDYDFDGSIMSMLLDVLAYNTHYNSLYTNMAINEMFIDSASKRASVVSMAKLMGYRSKSITSARATVNVTAVPPISYTGLTYTIPAGTVFGASLGDSVYKFSTMEDVSANRANTSGTFYFPSVKLIEGTRTRITYEVGAGVQFVIPQRNADISSVKVRVFENNTTLAFTTFNPAESIMNTTAESAVFFVKQREDQFYELYFGNDVFGKSVQTGNAIVIEYVLSSGDVVNKANTFVYASGADSSFTFNVSTSQAAYGGAPEETIDSIRFNAPRNFVAQNRAVTADDYSAMMFSSFPTIESLNVWGGQDNTPPVYGKVFIAAKPYGRDAYSTAEKTTMLDTLLHSKSIITVKPEFVDPQFLDVELTTTVYYNPYKTTKSATELQTAVVNTISGYSNTLGKFDTSYRHSKMSRMIDATDEAIVSNISKVIVRYGFTPTYNTLYNYSIKLGNPISKSADALVKTTRFYHANYEDRCFVMNDGLLLKLYTETPAGDATYRETVGSFAFDGTITMNALNIVGLYDTKLEIIFTPYSFDVIPVNNYIVRLPGNLATVNVLADTNTTHIFSGS